MNVQKSAGAANSYNNYVELVNALPEMGDIQVSHQRPGLSVIIAGLRKCSGHDLRLPLATHVKRG